MRILLLEPFYGGSHQSFCENLMSRIDAEWTLLTLPARHWKWRSRGALLHWCSTETEVLSAQYDLIVCTSMLPVCEFRALAVQQRQTPIIVYCHENQFTYPVQSKQPRDHHYGFTELVSFAAADRIIFNSEYNRKSFFINARKLLSRMPDYRPLKVLEDIAKKSQVLPVLYRYPTFKMRAEKQRDDLGPLILWNHRWEYDKNPEAFFKALDYLKAQNRNFRLSLCGERYTKAPKCFEDGIEKYRDHLVHESGFLKRTEYMSHLHDVDIVVSTSWHEFFGLSMLEAAMAGAYPLVPNRLVYPEMYPAEFLYEDDSTLGKRLLALCDDYSSGGRLHRNRQRLFERFVNRVDERFSVLFQSVINDAQS